MTHICVGKLTIIGSDNGLSPERRLAIIWTNAGILLIGPFGTNFSEILIEIQPFSLKKIRLKMSSAKCSFRLGLNVLKECVYTKWPATVMTHSWSEAMSHNFSFMKDSPNIIRLWIPLIRCSFLHVCYAGTANHMMVLKCFPHHQPFSEENLPITGGFPSQKTSNVEMWYFVWCHMQPGTSCWTHIHKSEPVVSHVMTPTRPYVYRIIWIVDYAKSDALISWTK